MTNQKRSFLYRLFFQDPPQNVLDNSGGNVSSKAAEDAATEFMSETVHLVSESANVPATPVVSSQKKFCHKCGKENPKEQKFCGDCGQKLISGDVK